MVKVYLAGPITGESYEGATNWRQYAAERLREMGHVVYSPMRGKTYLQGQESIKAMYQVEGFLMSTSKGIYGRDKFDVKNADVVLANLEVGRAAVDKISVGTLMEIQRAHDLDKYTLVVMGEQNPHQHPFVVEAASLVVPDLEEAIKIIYWLGGGDGSV